MKKLLTNILILCVVFAVRADETPVPDQSLVYKSIGEVSLKLHIFNPPDHRPTDRTPAILFFHGGGWQGGGYMQFSGQCKHLASRGLVAMTAEYRTGKRFGTTPKECVKDAKSAMRWVRANADELGVDPNRLAAGGGSAGGHLAAATAILDGFNEAGEEASVSCLPNALVLFNPVADNGPGGFGHDRVKAYWKEFSPLHNLHDEAPPTLILTGSEDTAFSVGSAKAYQEKMEALGRRCDLHIYQGQPHAFFNRGHSEEMYFRTTLEADRFLVSLGYLSGRKTSEAIITTMDLMPTFARLAGTELPENLRIDGKATPKRMRWWARMIDEVPELQLYDLSKDMGEQTNVVSQYPEVVDRLLKQVEIARAELGDCDRTGAGARFFDPQPRRPDIVEYKHSSAPGKHP